MQNINELLVNEKLCLNFFNRFNDDLVSNHNTICVLLSHFVYAKKKINRLNFFLFRCLISRGLNIDFNYFRRCFAVYWKYSFFFYAKRRSLLFIFLEFYYAGVELLEFTFDYFYDDKVVYRHILPFDDYNLSLDILHFLVIWVASEGLRVSKYNQYIIGHYYISTRKNIRKSFVKTIYRRNKVKDLYVLRRSVRFTVAEGFIYALRKNKFYLFFLEKYYNIGMDFPIPSLTWNWFSSQPLLWFLRLSKPLSDSIAESDILTISVDMWLNILTLVMMAKYSDSFYSKRNVYFNLEDLFKALIVHPKEIMLFICGYSNFVEQTLLTQFFSGNQFMESYYFLNDLSNYTLAPYINNEFLIKQRYCFRIIKYIASDHIAANFFSFLASSRIRKRGNVFWSFYWTIFSNSILFGLECKTSNWNLGFLLNRFTLVIDYLYWRLHHPEHDDQYFYDTRLDEHLTINPTFFLKLDVDNILFSRYLMVYFNLYDVLLNDGYYMDLNCPTDGFEHYYASTKLPYYEPLSTNEFLFFFMLKDWFSRLFLKSFKFSCVYFFNYKKINFKPLDGLFYNFGYYQATRLASIVLNNYWFRLHFYYYKTIFKEYRFYLNEYSYLKSLGKAPSFVDFKKKWDLKHKIILNPLWWNKFVVKNVTYIKYRYDEDEPK